MKNWISINKDEKHIKKEREKARVLRQSRWWKQKLMEGVCYYCGKQFSPSELTMDHRLPLARGGKSTQGNCVPCCKECNKTKKCLTPAELILNQIRQPS
ncbi:MAG: HNH endonuclease [Candidatus Aureabacteria bacterium]|nr:HNH endonuclease [Candidatus Auribacterota bacterium]